MFVLIVLLAAALRFVDLPTRGTWDADQGHDMLVLRDLVRDGAIPLLGPPTSIGDFHHGMLYYLLLAPAAAISNADPTVVTAWIALGGTVAVAVTGWLARAIGGSVAGLIAALLIAVSASAVDESTFIWNPNLIALSSSVALAAAWQAWRTRQAGWWVVAGGAAVITMHCHVLGVVLTQMIAALLVADASRRRSGDARSVVGAAVVWIVLLLLSYLPLAVHELQTGGSELRAALAFLSGGGGAGAIALPVRLPIVAFRVVGWPLVGLLTDAPILSLLAAGLVVVLAAWRGWFGGPWHSVSIAPSAVGNGLRNLNDERTAVRWLGLGLLWSIVALAVGASSLATVVIGLPNDHYHAFADPIVFVLVGVGVSALIRQLNSAPERLAASGARASAARGSSISVAVAAAIVVGLVGWNAVHQPPAVATDGGWPAAEAAAARVLVATRHSPLTLAGLPAVKPTDALRFPLEELVPGVVVSTPPVGTGNHVDLTPRVILCDQLFHETIGADCGGPAEDAALGREIGQPVPANFALDRFQAAPGRWVTIYGPTKQK